MKKSFIYILIIFSLISQNIFADTLFQNDIKNITFTKNSIGKPEINITLDKNETINVIKKDDLEYVILMPETSSSLKGKPSLDKVSDVITGIDIKTQPYAKNIKGYTKITIRTTKPLSLNTKTIAYKPNTNVQKQPVKQTVKPDVIAQQVPKPTVKPVVKQEVKQDTSKQIEQNTKSDVSTSKPNGKSLFNKEPDIVILPVQKAEKPKTTAKKDVKPETNENIKTAEKVSQPKPVVNKTQKQDVPEKIALAPEKTEPKVQQPAVVKEETEEIIPTTQPSEPEVKAPEQVKKAEPAKPVKKSKSLFTSVFITGVLLLLLLFLKLLNKKDKYVKLQDVIAKNTDDNSENPQEEIVQEEINNLYGEEQVSKPRFTPPEEIIMPVHESFEHNTVLNEEEIPNEEILSELETSEEYNEPQEVPQEVIQENIDVPAETEEPEIIPPVTLQQEETVQEEIEQEETPLQTEEISASTEDYAYQSMQEPLANTTFETIDAVDTTIDVEDSFNENFNENVSVDDVFGVFDDEHETPENLVNNTEETVQEELPMANLSEESTLNENTGVYENTENVEVKTAGESDVTSENEIQTESEVQEESDIVTENEENTSEPEETQPEEETEVVQDSYNFTPTKSIYLINYEGVSILMASIKDEFFVLKKFDEIIDKPLMVRQTEKNSKKTTYIVRIGSFRGVIEVTLKNLEMVLEL